MGRDDEFAGLVRDRWPALVRASVLLGCTVAEAEDLAQTALLRCYVAWNRVRSAADRDAYVYRVLVNCHRDSRRRRWWGERPAEQAPDVAVDDGTGRVDDLDAVRRALGRLGGRRPAGGCAAGYVTERNVTATVCRCLPIVRPIALAAGSCSRP